MASIYGANRPLDLGDDRGTRSRAPRGASATSGRELERGRAFGAHRDAPPLTAGVVMLR